MKPRQSLDHRETETCAVIASVVRVVGLHEGIAKLGQILVGNADTVIGDGEFHIAAAAVYCTLSLFHCRVNAGFGA